MSHGYSDQSGNPVKSTLLNRKLIEYDSRIEKLEFGENEDSEVYDVNNYDVRIPIRGGPVIIDGESFENWSDIRGELE